jgi:hypothetical protein
LKRKLNDSDFLDFISGSDIVLLGETWLNENDVTIQNAGIQGYECEHVYGMKSTGSKRGRYSGGVSIYYKDNLKKYVEVIEKSKYGYMWIKLDKQLFDFDEDVYMSYIYVRPNDSRVFREDEFDFGDMLEACISKYESKGKVIITGDFNSRIGNDKDMSDTLDYDHYIDPIEQDCFYSRDVPARVNKDHVLDSSGRRLLELCRATGLTIANGRLGNDAGVGEFTYCS